MKVKNVLKSEECQDLRYMIGLANSLIKKVNEIEQKSDTNELVKVGSKMREVQNELCALLGKAVNNTLATAQEIEVEEGSEIKRLSRPKQTEETAQDEEQAKK